MPTHLAKRLYAAMPDRLLYHYTGYEALLGIVRTAELWATDIHYFNDSSELQHAVVLFQTALRTVGDSAAFPSEMIEQLRNWLDQRLADGHRLFVSCFSEDGNLLSQWRGYTPHGNGVSLGFDPAFLSTCASAQGFEIGRCIYDREHQAAVAKEAIESLLQYATTCGPAMPQQAHPSQSYYPTFFAQEVHLLSIAALLKNPAFVAELEWRAVSPVWPSYVDNPARYRAGRTTLIPYMPLPLGVNSASPMRLAHVYLGPTPQTNLAMGALSTFLAANRLNPASGLQASLLPYRET